MIAAIIFFIIVGALYSGYNYWQSLRYAYTDDAYVQGNLVQVTPQVGGTVVAIDGDDTQLVKVGQPLVQLDGADTHVALQQAEAMLAQAVRQVRVSFANNGTLAAQVAVRQTDVATAQANLAKAEDAQRRRQELAGTGAVGAEELRQAQIAVQAAKAALTTAQAGVRAAQEQLAGGEALTAGTVIADNPSVRLAAAKVREAYLAYERTMIPAPVSGVVAQRTVQLGQRVAPGMPLMWVVPLNDVWINANLKETQLRDVRIGQPAKVVADTYGSSFTYTGRVVGLSAGTGAAFSLLPAQNATGNWIKVVQRLPVRVALDPKQLASHPLRVGMSTEVTITISDHKGPLVTDMPPTGPAASTDVYAADWKKADALVNSIVAANAGGKR
ncbi:MAG: efflux RND transporter periplasmic adaptor subunit [Betaproteobacteria bacterium]|nr:efflux RND transporter periplasmic adaptor subunit [Betaproteobacteria bacterium]MDE2123752.1 efflux RND transporter periplasmic adaptor subunit [Betaproteobacteria bacterium]MDE2185176.1 efflux RND transporter periplasmic adaptor subunit [Betaproteobacteria bacterium]MDE2324123.1 efflux RND transporter periplasmic adaptor subunit [Betaproteobacteria bacterium]